MVGWLIGCVVLCSLSVGLRAVYMLCSRVEEVVIHVDENRKQDDIFKTS